MAKQRPQPKSKAPHQPAPAGSASARTPEPAAGKRSGYVEAVALYEKGLEALQRHDYAEALRLFENILSAHPDERELHERIRLYLNICRRHVAPQQAAPRTVQERLYASTLALNGGRYDEAISHLRLVRDEDPDNDHALYMLAVAHAQRGEHAEAVAHLERAIALNPENRALARRDQDLDPLRDDDAFQSAVDGHRTAGSRPGSAR
jgi:outer membrane protein assembly factor BamD (BamD/ComL family)